MNSGNEAWRSLVNLGHDIMAHLVKLPDNFTFRFLCLNGRIRSPLKERQKRFRMEVNLPQLIENALEPKPYFSNYAKS